MSNQAKQACFGIPTLKELFFWNKNRVDHKIEPFFHEKVKHNRPKNEKWGGPCSPNNKENQKSEISEQAKLVCFGWPTLKQLFCLKINRVNHKKDPFFHEKIQKKTGTKIENEAPHDPQITVKKRKVKYQIKQIVCVLEDQHWKNYFVWRATK